MKTSIRRLMIIGLVCVLSSPHTVHAQIPVLDIIKAGVKKVIKAMDLKVQRLQNKTIWLQNAQKVLENEMSKLKLDEISSWSEKQRALYRDYFDELYKVKAIINYYEHIKNITKKQAALVQMYKQAWARLQQDTHFTQTELNYMASIYAGILDESMRNIDELAMVSNSFTTQMSDAKRMDIIRTVEKRVNRNYNDLLEFNYNNMQLSLQRAQTLSDIQTTKKLYGIK